MRVYELAKQLGMENRDLIPELKRLGIAVASHSSALEPDAVQKVLDKLAPKQKAPIKSAADAGRLDRDRRHVRIRFGAPVWIAHRGDTHRERVGTGGSIDEAVHDVGDDSLRLGRVIHAQHLPVGAQEADRLRVPCFVSCFAQDPIDDRLLWALRRETLYPDKTRGISNEMTGETASISIESGLLLIVHRRS